MQKFRLLATHCTAAGSPTRSPTTSPVIHLRRRKTLRMLLSRGGERRLPSLSDDGSPDGSRQQNSPEKPKDLSARQKLKDLFVSSPPPPFRKRASEGLPPSSDGGRWRGTRSLRPMSAGLRQRLLRRAWRPALGAIPE